MKTSERIQLGIDATPIRHTLADLAAKRHWHFLNAEPFVHALGAVTGNRSGIERHERIL